MEIKPGFLVVIAKLQEAAAKMSHDDIQSRLRDALNDKYRSSGSWSYLVTVFGDDKSGDVVYSCDSDLMRAPYTCAATGATIDFEAAVDVVPLTTYELEPTGVDASESGARNSKRDQKQLQAMHDASVTLGAACSSVKESVSRETKQKTSEKSTAPLQLVESAATTEQIVIREAKADYEIKLIAPGKGSSAFYPSEVLKRDGPQVFKAGTHVYINHPTLAEEAARPEGDVKNLAGVLTGGAVWNESHAKGPGLYGRMKVFADHAQMVEEKAAHVGMSIRASGVAESGVMREGVPVLKALTGAESVDVVTRAGAGGMILTESAKIPNSTGGEVSMTEAEKAEVQKLVESAVTQATAPLKERALRSDAFIAASRTLSTVTLPEVSKQRVIESVLRDSVPMKDGAIDETKLSEIVMAEAKREGAYLAQIGGNRITGHGSPAAPVMTAEKLAEAKKAAADENAEFEGIFAELGLNETQRKAAVAGRAN